MLTFHSLLMFLIYKVKMINIVPAIQLQLLFEVLEVAPLPLAASAQQAELYALTQACM